MGTDGDPTFYALIEEVDVCIDCPSAYHEEGKAECRHCSRLIKTKTAYLTYRNPPYWYCHKCFKLLRKSCRKEKQNV